MKPNNLKNILGDLESFETEKEIKVIRDEDLEKTLDTLLDVYKTVVATKLNPYQLEEYAFYSACLAQLKRTKCGINEKAISELVLRIMRHNDQFNFGQNAGQFVTACIQESYLEGHNNFELEITEPLSGLGVYLRGQPDNKLTLKVNNFAASANAINNIRQGWFTDAANLDVTIWGAGNGPANATHTFGGLISINYYYSKKSIFIGYYSKESIFRVDDKDVFDYLNAVKNQVGNEVYLLEKPEPNVVLLEHNHEKAEFNLAVEA